MNNKLLDILEPFIEKSGSDQIINDINIQGYEEDENVIKYLKEVVIPHKVEVWNAGINIIEKYSELLESYSISTMKLINVLYYHDLSKFSNLEAIEYCETYYTKTKERLNSLAWLHHIHNNKYHPEFWIAGNKKMDMSNIHILEMICDWVGAGVIYGNPIEKWIPENIQNINSMLSKKSRKILKRMLYELFPNII